MWLNDKIFGILFGQVVGDALDLAAEGMSCGQVATACPNGVNKLFGYRLGRFPASLAPR